MVRVLPPLTHRLAEAMPGFASALDPVVEHIAQLLGTASPYDPSLPSTLTGEKHKCSGPTAHRLEDGGSAATIAPSGAWDRRNEASEEAATEGQPLRWKPPCRSPSARGVASHFPLSPTGLAGERYLLPSLPR